LLHTPLQVTYCHTPLKKIIVFPPEITCCPSWNNMIFALFINNLLLQRNDYSSPPQRTCCHTLEIRCTIFSQVEIWSTCGVCIVFGQCKEKGFEISIKQIG
jgi:hypothetical protein